MKKYFYNYKTSIPAAIMLVAIILYWTAKISTEQFLTGIAALTAAGLIGARDVSNKPPDVQ